MKNHSSIAAMMMFSVLGWAQCAYAFRAAHVSVDQAELKAAADASSATQATLPVGTRVNTADQPKNGFYRVTSATQSGWLPQEDLDFGAGAPPPPANNPPSENPAQSSDSSAQTKENKPSKYELGFVGSFQVSSLSTSYNSSNDSSTVTGATNGGLSSGSGLGFGFVFSDKISPSFSLETGWLYQPRHFSQTVTGSANGTVTSSYTYKYWQIPVIARFRLFDPFTVGAGMYFADAMGDISDTATSTSASSTVPSTTQYLSYQNNSISRTDYGFLLAAGGKFPLGAGRFSIYTDARYELGLKNINNGALTTQNSANPPDSNKWHDFQLLAGLSYAL